MRLTESIYLVGSGSFGFGLTHDSDCHVYAIVADNEVALVDCGAGLGYAQIVSNLLADGLEPAQVKQLFLTHYHPDHAGGAHAWRQTYGCQIIASQPTASALDDGNEQITGLEAARVAGIYPRDYHLIPCPVDRTVKDGDRLEVGNVTLRVIETPGHCHGHLAFHGQIAGRYYLFTGDSVLFGGRIIIQNVPDCVLSEYCATILRLAEVPTDVLLPGHLMFSLRDGHRHLTAAAQIVRALLIPPNAI